MHFLGGERIFIKPVSSNCSFEDQFNSCLQQLHDINHHLKLYKLNAFVDSRNNNEYSQQRALIKKAVDTEFAKSLLISIISQTPLTCQLIFEAFYFDDKAWTSDLTEHAFGASICFRNADTEFLIGTIQVNEFSKAKDNAVQAFEQLRLCLSVNIFNIASIIRQWNYIQDILGHDDKHQNYQDFNDVRSDFYARHFENNGYPAATGIGIKRGGIIIEFIAMKTNSSVTNALDNSQQISAHKYSNNVLEGDQKLKTTPKFERARYLQCFDSEMIFISGTASILGEKTVGINDAEKQTKVTIQNIQELYSDRNISSLKLKNRSTKFGHARIYVKHASDFETIRSLCQSIYIDLPMVFIKADICRDDLLVEIEGEVIIKKLG